MLSFIKVISTGLMCITIAWELGHLSDLPIWQTIPNYFNYIFLLARFALIIHVIEGIAAAYYAPTQNKNPLKYGIYTFTA
ncbi:hypothetical protein [Aphanothece sacrum]|nr:hypothetical protein [Aphanothece sacrum]